MWCALLPEEKASLEVWRETWRLLGMPVSELRLALLFPYIYTGVYTLFSFCPAPFQSCERCSTLVCEAGSGTFQLRSSWLLQCSCHSVSLASLTSLGFLQNLLAGFRPPHHRCRADRTWSWIVSVSWCATVLEVFWFGSPEL